MELRETPKDNTLRRLTFLIIMLFISSISYADTSVNFAGTGENVAVTGGDHNWANTSNISADDDVIASVNVDPDQQSNYLIGDNFGFAIPATVTINGIQFDIGRWSTGNGDCSDLKARVVKAGTVGAVDKDIPGNWSATETEQTYGGAADLWSQAWSPSDINHADFGFALQTEETEGKSDDETCKVDYIQATITYTPAPGTFQGVTLSGTSKS